MNIFVFLIYAGYTWPKYSIFSFSSVFAVRIKNIMDAIVGSMDKIDISLRNTPKLKNNNELYIGWRIYL